MADTPQKTSELPPITVDQLLDNDLLTIARPGVPSNGDFKLPVSEAKQLSTASSEYSSLANAGLIGPLDYLNLNSKQDATVPVSTLDSNFDAALQGSAVVKGKDSTGQDAIVYAQVQGFPSVVLTASKTLNPTLPSDFYKQYVYQGSDTITITIPGPSATNVYVGNPEFDVLVEGTGTVNIATNGGAVIWRTPGFLASATGPYNSLKLRYMESGKWAIVSATSLNAASNYNITALPGVLETWTGATASGGTGTAITAWTNSGTAGNPTDFANAPLLVNGVLAANGTDSVPALEFVAPVSGSPNTDNKRIPIPNNYVPLGNDYCVVVVGSLSSPISGAGNWVGCQRGSVPTRCVVGYAAPVFLAGPNFNEGALHDRTGMANDTAVRIFVLFNSLTSGRFWINGGAPIMTNLPYTLPSAAVPISRLTLGCSWTGTLDTNLTEPLRGRLYAAYFGPSSFINQVNNVVSQRILPQFHTTTKPAWTPLIF